MGYDFHIARRAQWSDDVDNIAKDEFLALPGTDPEFFRSGEIGDGVLWLSARTGRSWPLFWRNGQIDCKNPPQELVNKLKIVARRMKANLQGDDGEPYYLAATGESSSGIRPLGWKPWWKIW
jgi:hypothetical protein